jgi:hypothetical protein
MQTEVFGLTAMVQEIRNAILPNAPPILSLHALHDLPLEPLRSIMTSIPSTLHIFQTRRYHPLHARFNRGNESPSTYLHLPTGDSQIGSGTSLNLGECDMDTPIRFDQY